MASTHLVNLSTITNRFCPRRSESSSCSSSCSVSRSPVPCRYRLPYPRSRSWNRSQSRSKSWSRSGSRSRSRSPTTLAYRRAQRWRRDCYSDHYGFVTFYNMKDAFAAIENGYKLRRPDELPFDLCFGGRRQFCKSTYADLDYNQEEVDHTPAKSKEEELDFDTLLKQAQKGLKR